MSEILSAISTAVIEGNLDDITDLTQDALDEGLEAQDILNGAGLLLLGRSGVAAMSLNAVLDLAIGLPALFAVGSRREARRRQRAAVARRGSRAGHGACRHGCSCRCPAGRR